MNDKISNNFLVIMAGGIGSRFWPSSRNQRPKQFLDILGTGSSLLQMTYERFLPHFPKENIFIVTNSDYTQLVADQLPALSQGQILSEPFRKNTAPCIAYASYKIYKINPEANIVVTPSDHAIFNEEIFSKTLQKALRAASEKDKLITLGIQPTRPETAYGYIQYIQDRSDEVKKVKTFTEKPEQDLAQKFIESGDFVWNSGIFIWSARAIITSFQKHMPLMAEIFEEASNSFSSPEEAHQISVAYAQCKNISIDYGIMEKADNVFVILGKFAWSDLGTWNSIHDLREKDENGNVLDANTMIYDSTDCIIKGPKDQLIVVQGLSGYLVVHSENVTLICKKDDEQLFREFVSDVKAKKGSEYL
jgi:mannose-1-phosphate guanylyltransferase